MSSGFASSGSSLRSLMAALFSQRRCSIRVGLCLALILFTQQIHAKTIDVGGVSGWSAFDPSTLAAPNYAAWSSAQRIITGDILVFTYLPGFHNIYSLPTKAALDICDFSQATELDAGNAGSYAWRATKPGSFYFACNKGTEGTGTHCDVGQKLAINVLASTASAPKSAPALPAPIAPTSPVSISPTSPKSIAPASPIAIAPSPTFAPGPSVPSAPSPIAISPSPVGSPLASPPVALTPTIVPVPPPTVSAPVPAAAVPAPSVPTPTVSPAIAPAAAVPTPSLTPAASPPAPPTGPSTQPQGTPGPSTTSPSPSAGMILNAQAWSATLLASALLLLL